MPQEISIPKFAIETDPVGDRVVVFPLPEHVKTSMKFDIPDSHKKEKPMFGLVVALGKGGAWKDCPNPSAVLAVGDEVAFGEYSGDDVRVPVEGGTSEKVKVLHLEHVLFKVNRK